MFIFDSTTNTTSTTTHATITIILSITKTGDPFVFGRGGEEVLEFREFGVEPSIIPVSSVCVCVVVVVVI